MPKRKSATTASPRAANGSHKRQLREATTTTPSSRSSKRIKSIADSTPPSKSTPTKSKYFEQSDSEVVDSSDGAESGSGYEDEEASATEVSEPASDTDEYDSEEETSHKKPKQHKGTPSQTGKVVPARKDLWREGVKAGLGPGKEVFIQKPKARGDGGIKYVPEKIHPHTFEFLKDLKNNNDRTWLKAHDPDYRQSWKDFESFVESLTEKIAEVDEEVPELPPKDLVFRIYRDIRFSSDPTPYKPHFSAAWSRTGRKGPYACYYVHIQPGHNFVGSGLWHPDAAPLALLRQDIDRHPERIRSVLTGAGLRKHIFGGIAKDEKKAIKAFANRNAENALKTKPKV